MIYQKRKGSGLSMNIKNFFITLTAVLTVVCSMYFISVIRQVSLQSQAGYQADAGLGDKQNIGYIVKDYAGKIAVFFPGNEQPEVVFDTYTKHLPEYDQIEIKKGIRVPDYPSLIKLIEDFTS